MQIEGWNVLDEERAVMWREYPFAKDAYATTMVFRGDGGLVVISPGEGLERRALDALAEFGPVQALVANNGMHHMGQREWRSRFPDAQSYAPAASLPTLAKKIPGVSLQPLASLALPSHAKVHEAPGFKQGECLVSIETLRGKAWYTGDLLTNIQRTPTGPMRWFLAATGSAPGFRLFRPAAWFLVSDKKRVREWMLTRFEAERPALVIPAHGPVVEAPDLPAQVREQLGRL